MIEWIKLAEFSGRPEHGEVVLVCDEGEWTHAVHIAGKFYPVDSECYADMTDHIRGITHWARVELPYGN